MDQGDVSIEQVRTASEEIVDAFARLIPLLSSTTPPDIVALASIVSDDATVLLIARLGGEIVGSLTLATFSAPTGVRAWIEDVVVDDRHRGRGIATQLIHRAIEHAASVGARNVDLTSRPSRTAANRLYQSLGFVRRETNVYRVQLDS